ncbi:hypothetical protein C3L33_16222, partial [Rhododendron williamsianum]
MDMAATLESVCPPERRETKSVADFDCLPEYDIADRFGKVLPGEELEDECKFILEHQNEIKCCEDDFDYEEYIYATTGYRKFTEEVRLKYNEEIEKTGDSDLEEGTLAREAVDYCSKFAINRYNKDNEKDFEFVKVVKAAHEICCGCSILPFRPSKETNPLRHSKLS